MAVTTKMAFIPWVPLLVPVEPIYKACSHCAILESYKNEHFENNANFVCGIPKMVLIARRETDQLFCINSTHCEPSKGPLSFKQRSKPLPSILQTMQVV